MITQDIVGSRVWLGRLPENPVLPAIRYNPIVMMDQAPHMKGVSNLTRVSFTFSLYSLDYNQVRNLVGETLLALGGFRGNMVGPGTDIIQLQSIQPRSIIFGGPEADTNLYYANVELIVW